jgi:hypothetical protein
MIQAEVPWPPEAGSIQSAERPQWMACFRTPLGAAACAAVELPWSIPIKPSKIPAQNNWFLRTRIDVLPSGNLGRTGVSPVLRQMFFDMNVLTGETPVLPGVLVIHIHYPGFSANFNAYHKGNDIDCQDELLRNKAGKSLTKGIMESKLSSNLTLWFSKDNEGTGDNPFNFFCAREPC